MASVQVVVKAMVTKRMKLTSTMTMTRMVKMLKMLRMTNGNEEGKVDEHNERSVKATPRLYSLLSASFFILSFF